MGRRTRIVETSSRVFELRTSKGRALKNGRVAKVSTIKQLSGPGMTPEEWETLSARIVAEMMSSGFEVHAWDLKLSA